MFVTWNAQDLKMEFTLVMREKNVLTMPPGFGCESPGEWRCHIVEMEKAKEEFNMELKINNSDVLSVRCIQDILLDISSRFLVVSLGILSYP